MSNVRLWDSCVHGPVPAGWRVVRYRAELDQLEIAPTFYAVPLMATLLTLVYSRWLWVSLTRSLPTWWHQRPRL